MALATLQAACKCGGALERLDESDDSMTVLCTVCQQASLIVGALGFTRSIRLRDFHLKRGDSPHQRPIGDLTMATKLYEDLVLDRWPSPATVVDYGIDSASHLGALQYAVRGGISPYDLDRVMGDGDAITQLVRSVPHQPYSFVTFRTPYDGVWRLLDKD